MNILFRIGDKVNHGKFGQGIVLDVFYVRNKLVISVKFDSLKTERNIVSRFLII